MQTAYNSAPRLKANELLLRVLNIRKNRGKVGVDNTDKKELENKSGLKTDPVIIHRKVESDLISTLYKLNTRELNRTPDTRFGNGECSSDYELFRVDDPLIQSVASDLTDMMQNAVGTEVFVYDSFFNIYRHGAGITPHTHLNKMDGEKFFNLKEQKYSLVYYLAVGDQDGDEPGILRLFDPDEDVLPSEGMIAIFPAGRKHSATYNGWRDRVMIGANFYALK